MYNQPTIVTGLWDIKRGNLPEDKGFSRDFENHYISNFRKLLSLDVAMYIIVPPELVSIVKEARGNKPTHIREMTLEDVKKMMTPFWDDIQRIRNDETWANQTGEDGWLKHSPQSSLEYYNPIVMNKLFFLNDARITNPFDTTHFYWIDAGITNTVSLDILNNGWIDYICDYDSVWLSYPYTSNTEIHGFTREGMNKFCNADFVDYVVRGGFFGGSADIISEINGVYYHLLDRTLKEGFMGTEESVFTIMSYQHPDLIRLHKLQDGWVAPFFRDVIKEGSKEKKTALYVISFNAPAQFEFLLQSMDNYDKRFLSLTERYLINNSTEVEHKEKYDLLCEQYGFTQFKEGNLGITGGREFAASHFEKSEHKYMFFFEDDMTLADSDELCGSGFMRKVPNLYQTCIRVLEREQLDYLKLCFTEHFYPNSVQVAWYNVSQPKREELFNGAKKATHTVFHTIKSYMGVPYATGEVFFCNWPHLITKEGSRKIFHERQYLWPAENLVMAFVHERLVKKEIKAGILLASPIQHKRVEKYDHKDRKEY